MPSDWWRKFSYNCPDPYRIVIPGSPVVEQMLEDKGRMVGLPLAAQLL